MGQSYLSEIPGFLQTSEYEGRVQKLLPEGTLPPAIIWMNHKDKFITMDPCSTIILKFNLFPLFKLISPDILNSAQNQQPTTVNREILASILFS
jgi:hypothetical protein